MELVRRLAAEGLRVFTTSQARKLAPAIGLSEGYFRQALHHLAKSGWLVRLRNGLYSLSSALPGVRLAHDFEVAMFLVKPAAISHWSALHHHGLTDQVPRTVFVTTTTDVSVPRRRGSTPSTRSQHRSGYLVGDTLYQFVQVKPERFFGTERLWVDDTRVAFTDPERTLLDGLSMPQYCGDFAEVLTAFEMRGDDLDLERIIDYCLRLDAATAKRLGWVLEKQGIAPSKIAPLLELPIKGYRKLDPTGPGKGTCSRRWMIQENLPGMLKP